MYIIHDSRLPKQAIATLQKQGNCISFLTKNITYNAIAGHPDIFFCPIEEDVIIVAPNTPKQYIQLLQQDNKTIIMGTKNVGSDKHNSTCYNAVITSEFIIHNKKYTDNSILEKNSDRTFIHVNQAYTRCSLLPLKNNTFITSDKGIEKVLLNHKLNVCYVSPTDIILPDFKHGFIGGCMGTSCNNVYIIGSLCTHTEGEKVRAFLESLNYSIIELYDGPLYDGGSLFFI